MCTRITPERWLRRFSRHPQLKSVTQIRAALLKMGIVISEPLGFNNTYALAVKEDFANANGLLRISDLARLRATIRCGFSYEFMDRRDGYGGLADRYRLGFDAAARQPHGTQPDVPPGQSTSMRWTSSTCIPPMPRSRNSCLRVLEDDLHYFPTYQAVWVARSAFVDTLSGSVARAAAVGGSDRARTACRISMPRWISTNTV